MKLELFFAVMTGFVVYNLYYDNHYMKLYHQYKKYIHIGFIIFTSYSIYISLLRTPQNAMKQLLQQSKIPNPFASSPYFDHSVLDLTQTTSVGDGAKQQNPTRKKRAVSETAKKEAAARQNWQCSHCRKQLTAYFEVDHVVRLDEGGSNALSNLEALCRECHAKKTGSEIMKRYL